MSAVHILSTRPTDRWQTPGRISARSLWTDSVWYFDPDRPSAPSGTFTMHWNIEMGDGTTLLAPKWKSLLNECRLLVWSLHYDRRQGRNLSLSSIPKHRSELGRLLPWMAENSYGSLGDLDNIASWEYHDHVLRLLRKQGNDDFFPSALSHPLMLLSQIHGQGPVFDEAAMNAMPDIPFDGKAPSYLGKEASKKAQGWIEPMPDPVTIKILAAAYRMIGAPAKDILKLQQHYIDARGAVRVKGERYTQVLEDFEFSIIPGEDKPWRDPIGAEVDLSFFFGRPVQRSDTVLRNLINDVAAACLILVQGTSGVRVSELCAIRSGWDKDRDLPDCVQVRRSKSGLSELFYLVSQEFKTQNGAQMEWVIGMRPVGTRYEPPAVKALRVLEVLFAPWREMAGSPALVVTFSTSGSLPREKEFIGWADGKYVADATRAFSLRYASLHELPDTWVSNGKTYDLSKYKSGEAIRSHRWRKSFAQFILRVDPSMLPEISRHFKHMSIALTETGYIGNDPELLDSIDSIRRQSVVGFLLQQLRGATPLAGGMAKLIDAQRERLRETASSNPKLSEEESLESWVLETDLRIWFNPHGKCFIDLFPADARCHRLAGTSPWLATAPNYAHQSPSVCCGCNCFGVDHEHLDFWTDRLRRGELVLQSAGPGKNHEYRVEFERVRQARSIVRALTKNDFGAEASHA